MTAPLFTVDGLEARPLSPEDAAAARELFASCDGTEDITCGLPLGTSDDVAMGAATGADLRIGIFEGPDTAGVIEVVRDTPAPGWWTIGLLMVETGRRGVSLGRDVLEAFGTWARAQGAEGLVVGVPAGSGEAFWRSAGFAEPVEHAGEAASGELVELRRALGTGPTG
jgi:hypothetical protein